MSDCNRFERDYGRNRSGELNTSESEWMLRHSQTCRFCAGYTKDEDNLRGLLKGQTDYQPQPGFDIRLQDRIRHGTQNVVQFRPGRGYLIPRWAAISAGLVTGLAAGAFLLLTPSSDNDGFNKATVVASTVTAGQKDSLAERDDSVKVPSDSYHLDQHSTTVSEDR